jgi:DNA-binding Lrp family transcriptional regulator
LSEQEIADRLGCSIKTVQRKLEKAEEEDIWKLYEKYSTRGICYAASKSEEKLSRFVNDSRFMSVFINEVHKLALKPGDQTRKENNKC